MSAPNEGRQSPPPEQQSGAQQQDPPASGHGVNEQSSNKDESTSQLEVCYAVSVKENSYLQEIQGLASNPKGPLDDKAAETLKKPLNPATDSSK
jgi:hypothetical protein